MKYLMIFFCSLILMFKILDPSIFVDPNIRIIICFNIKYIFTSLKSILVLKNYLDNQNKYLILKDPIRDDFS